jgi:hypothetical protein
MTNSTFPTSYRDPVYAAADQAASQATGIPPGLLTSIRVAGEKSNADQVSSASATTPYQFTPDTRQLIIKKYGIDPTASPEAAAMGAAYLLKEGIQRTGSAAGAVTQYIGGTDPANWGGQTRAYTNRVMTHFNKNGGQDTPQPDAQPQAPLPSAASYGLDPSVVGLGGGSQPTPGPAVVAAPAAAPPGANVNSQIVSDYNSGRLSPEDMAAVDQRVSSGQLKIDPTQLQRQAAPTPDANAGTAPSDNSANPAPTAPQPIGPKTLAAMQAGTLTPDQQATVKTGLANGTLTMPPQQPQQDATGPQNDGTYSDLGLLAGATGLPASAAPSAPQNPVTAAQNNSSWSDAAEKGVGNLAGSLLDIAGAGGRMVGGGLSAVGNTFAPAPTMSGLITGQQPQNFLQQAGSTVTDFANGAQQAHQQIDAKIANDTNNSVSGKVAGVVGSAVPYASMGGASLPGAMAGGAVAGAAPAIADNKSVGEIARDTVFGAGAGAAGFGIGKAASGLASSIAENPTVAKGIAKAKSLWNGAPSEGNKVAQAGGVRDAQDAADIAAASGQTPGQLATKLEAAPAPQTPGYTPTAAEMANDTNVTTVQKASTNANPSVAGTASAQNDAAIAKSLGTKAEPNNPGTAANPQAADQALEAAAQKSDALVAQGQTELPPVSLDVAKTLQAPQFEAPIKLAKRMAADEAGTGQPTVFDQLNSAKQADAADTLKQIIGTPEDLDARKASRGAQAADDFLSTHVGIPVDSPEMQSLFAKPAIKKAISQAETTAQNQGQSSIFSTSTNRANANLGGSVASPQKYVSGRGLVNAKLALDDQISAAGRAGENGQVKTLQGVKAHLLNVLDDAIPGYGQARANYATASGPIDAMESLQQRLYSAVHPTTGEVDPNKLINTINSIKSEQMKPGIRPADQVPKETLDALGALSDHLKNKNDLTGLPAEGQEYIRRALASSDKHAVASQEFQRTLNASPSYAELHGPHAQHIATVESAQTSQTALAKAQDIISNADSPAGLRALDKVLPDMEAADRSKAIALRQAKAKELAMGEVQERNLNAAGQTEFNRGTFRNASDKYSPYMAPNDAAQFGSVAQDLHNQTTAYAKTGKISGSDTAQNQNVARRLAGNIGDAIKDRAVQAMVGASVGSAAGIGGAGLGAAVGIIAPAIVKTITQKVSNITGENAAKLLSNGKLLAAALRNYESLSARRLFIEQLSRKVGYVAGATTANQFNSRR